MTAVLEQMQSEIALRMRSRDIRTERLPDPIDHIMELARMETECQSVDADRRTLQRIREALQRIRDGEYGLCIECGVMMPDRRLQALPYAERCVPCQEKEDAR